MTKNLTLFSKDLERLLQEAIIPFEIINNILFGHASFYGIIFAEIGNKRLLVIPIPKQAV
jgi:hypothetical protein